MDKKVIDFITVKTQDLLAAPSANPTLKKLPRRGLMLLIKRQRLRPMWKP